MKYRKMEKKMTHVFKKALAAVAIATACGNAIAGDAVVSSQVYSLEGVSSVTTDQTSNSISYQLKAAYAVGDKVTFAFTAGALVDSTTFPASLSVAADTTSGSEKAGMALGLLNSSADSVTYRVTSLEQPTGFTDKTTIGQTITLGAVTLKASAVAAGTTSVTVSSETQSGDVLDNASSTGQSRTAQLTETKSQFGALDSAGTFDAVIDVAQDRKGFVAGTNDDASFTISTIDTTDWLAVVPVEKTTVNLSADLAGFNLGTIGNVTTGAASAVTYDDAAKTVSIVYSSHVTNDTITITPPVGADAIVLGAQEFDLAANYTYSTNKTKELGSKPAGEWTLNGAMVNVPYMPYGTSISQIIYITNEGSLDADVNVIAFDEDGNNYDLGVVASVSANSVLSIAGEIKSGLEAEGYDMHGKVSLTITVNAQDSDISVYSAYNVGGSDRGTVANSQYKGK
jgi:hypothetical protein